MLSESLKFVFKLKLKKRGSSFLYLLIKETYIDHKEKMASSSSHASSTPPCAACKFLRRKCLADKFFVFRKKLDATNADLIRYTCNEMPTAAFPSGSSQYGRRMGHGGGSHDHNSGFAHPYSTPWNDDSSGDHNPDAGEG
ncbi:hypothetical protein F0562_004600 [Nyssa sinensis]|uniref:LOB domain-containing protein n=1 Tax=Nyssa sinensis TaxID=561372 RepID=A0A5J5BYY4_9ASTE|nr:hypothetical protein F0562_004600 [Nyssa sinensis]